MRVKSRMSFMVLPPVMTGGLQGQTSMRAGLWSLAKSGACKLKEFTVAGATQTVVMVCGKTTIKHVTTFHADSFETTGTATTPEGVKSSLLKGRRLGDCPAGGVE